MRHKIGHQSASCHQITTYPAYCPNIFSSFLFWVHLDLQTHLYNFYFFVFLSKSTLISAKAQIKQLGPFVSLPIYKSTKIRLFGQMSFSILYNIKLKPRETKIRLFGPPFKLEKFFKIEQLIKIGNNSGI